ncbi:MAG: hypothetical protein ACRD5J_12290, partial [Nitrososphaeraceae archaeon]
TRRGGAHSPYRLGFKRCTECGLFIKYSGIRCPCCSHTLRTKSRNKGKKYVSVRKFWNEEDNRVS